MVGSLALAALPLFLETFGQESKRFRRRFGVRLTLPAMSPVRDLDQLYWRSVILEFLGQQPRLLNWNDPVLGPVEDEERRGVLGHVLDRRCLLVGGGVVVESGTNERAEHRFLGQVVLRKRCQV